MRMNPQMALEKPNSEVVRPRPDEPLDHAAEAPAGGPPWDVARLLRDGQPDWAAVTHDVYCSRCGYNLRMLTRPLCPECGLEFEWRALFERQIGRSRFLFEHNWRERPFRSWVATVWRSLRPRAFWNHLSLHDRMHLAPLWLMLGLAPLVFLVGIHITAALGWASAELIERIDAPSGFAGPLGQGNVARFVSACRSSFRFLTMVPLKEPKVPGILLGLAASDGEIQRKQFEGALVGRGHNRCELCRDCRRAKAGMV